MAITASSLADGQVATTKGTIYTSSGISYIKSMLFHNSGASTETLELFIKRSGSSSRAIATVELAIGEYMVWDDPISLSSSDVIEASTTSATSVDYTITGATE